MMMIIKTNMVYYLALLFCQKFVKGFAEWYFYIKVIFYHYLPSL